MKRAILLTGALLALAAPTHAAERYLKCDVQTTFAKPGLGGSQWSHQEGRHTKYFRVDDTARVIATFNGRRNLYAPVCAPDQAGCSVRWSSSTIEADGRGAASPTATPDIDFRRAVTITQDGRHVVLVVADHGGGGVQPNMTWTQEGDCTPAQASDAQPMPYPPGPRSPTYVDARAYPVSDAERDRALASRYGNTVTGISGGRLWFHMWFFRDGLAYTGDDDDITAEGAVRQWFVGKEATGAYRLCEHPIAVEGALGCYPLNQPSIGDRWIEHDVYGDANFELLKGRQ